MAINKKMKKLIISLLLVSITLISNAQTPIKLRLADTKISTANDGTTIGRGDEFDVIVQANGNGNTTTRQLLFDLEYDRNNFSIVSINHTGTGGNGGVLPYGSTVQLSWQEYPGFKYAGTNTSTNGSLLYQTANYVGGGQATQAMSIIRATLTWASPNGMPYGGYDRMLVVRLKMKTTSTATTFDPVKLNFVAGWTSGGAYDVTYNDTPKTSEIIFDQNIGKYVTATVDVNSNLLNLSTLKVSFRDPSTNIGQLFNVLSDGKVDINQNSLTANTNYEVSIMHDMDKTNVIYNGAITISDFTTAQNQFQTMGLDGTAGTLLQTGQSYYAADINRNKTIDAGDLPQLLAQVAGFDTLYTVPAGYTQGSGGWMSLPTWRGTDATTIGGQTEWVYVTPGTTSSTINIDMRKFPQGTLPNTIKSIQLLDIYSGPIEYVSENQTWAVYTVPSNLNKTKDGSSLFNPLIRNINGGGIDYGLKIELDFNTSVNNSWGAITTNNWSDITYPKVTFRTGNLGTNAILDLKYLVWGDVNRSHSSQVVTSTGGVSVLKTNAVRSAMTNMSTNSFINTVNNISSIDVNLSNVTVTSNTIEIPVTINTNGSSVGGLQFEFQYDPTKIKFEELASNVPNTWYIFANSKNGKVKFGAIDQNKKIAITGSNTPFKLKFSTIGNGVDILTSVKVSPTMDASSSTGTQLGINLNTTQIKLTGYNNF